MVSYPKSTDKVITELNISEKLKEYPDWDREVQLKKNQPAMKLLAQLIQEHKNMSDEEAQQREVFFEGFKEIVDAQRSTEAKLYSNE